MTATIDHRDAPVVEPTPSPVPPTRRGLVRLADWCHRRRWPVVAVWMLVVVAATMLSSSVGGEHRVDYRLPGTESAVVRDVLADKYPALAGDAAFVVARADADVADPGVAQRLGDLSAELATSPSVSDVAPPIPSADGRTAILTVQLDAASEVIDYEDMDALMTVVAGANTDDLQVEVDGWAVQAAENAESGSEQFGLVAALVILLLAFGSALAAGIPLVLALLGVSVGGGMTMLIARFLDIPDWGSQLALMIGIGVGIDYALFVVTRYRSSLHDGESPHDAAMTSMDTAGRAVLFAGGTVLVSLLGLGAMGLDYLLGAAVAMAVTVLAVLAVTITLVPAILGFAGPNIDRFKVPGIRTNHGRSEGWARFSRRVQSRPVLFGLAGVAALVTMTIPFFGMRWGMPDAGTGPTEHTSRRAFDLIRDGFGPGANGPLQIVVDSGADPVEPAVASTTDAMAATAGVAAVLPPEISADGTAALYTVLPSSGPQDEATEDLVNRLRDDVLPPVEATEGVTASVGGVTALGIDEAQVESSRLPWFIAAVLVLSFLLLVAVFRAPLVALKAAVLNLLAIGAAYGVIAVAAQGGWLGNLIGIDQPTPVPVFVPILMFALLFGLSMDYEVFLLSRIAEEHRSGRSNEESVVEGVATTARVITAAAAIMVCVFAAFVLSGQVFMKLAGLGTATAVLLDATLVRLVLVPATMQLLGERNWWAPKWLDRVLPRIHIEG